MKDAIHRHVIKNVLRDWVEYVGEQPGYQQLL